MKTSEIGDNLFQAAKFSKKFTKAGSGLLGCSRTVNKIILPVMSLAKPT